MFKTDLNRRERKRFAEKLRSLAENATRSANALEVDQDDVASLMFSFVCVEMIALKEFNQILQDAIVSDSTKPSETQKSESTEKPQEVSSETRKVDAEVDFPDILYPKT